MTSGNVRENVPTRAQAADLFTVGTASIDRARSVIKRGEPELVALVGLTPSASWSHER